MSKELMRRLPTPSNEARRIVEKAVEKGRKLREQREGVERFILPISLPDYAASKGRNPTDYEPRGLQGHGSAESYYEAQTEALVRLNERRIETGCEVVIGISFDSVATEPWLMSKDVEVGVIGTGLRLKTG